MRSFLLLTLLLATLAIPVASENHSRDQGTIVRMHMTDCIGSQHPFMDTLSGNGRGPAGELCPEYVLVTDKVVYVIIGKGGDQLVPLAETTRFHFQNNEVLIRVDDARRESHFRVKEMILRPEWERNQQVEEFEAMHAAQHRMDSTVMVDTQ